MWALDRVKNELDRALRSALASGVPLSGLAGLTARVFTDIAAEQADVTEARDALLSICEAMAYAASFMGFPPEEIATLLNEYALARMKLLAPRIAPPAGRHTDA